MPKARVIDTRFPQDGYLFVGTEGGVMPAVPETTEGITTAAGGLGAPMTVPAPQFRGSCRWSARFAVGVVCGYCFLSRRR